MSNAIQKAIFNEMTERIGRLREVDLGLLLRSFLKLNYLRNEEFNERWGEVIEVLKYRLPEMKEPYEYESVMEFVHLLPASAASISLLVSSLNFFDKYEWQERGTLLTFARVCSSLISNCKLIEQIEHNKTFLRLTEIIANQTDNLKKLIPLLTINVPSFLSAGSLQRPHHLRRAEQIPARTGNSTHPHQYGQEGSGRQHSHAKTQGVPVYYSNYHHDSFLL